MPLFRRRSPQGSATSSGAGVLFALDAANGAERWRFAIGGAASWGPVATNGVLYLGDAFGSVYAIGGSHDTGSLTIDRQGNVWVADFGNKRIHAFSADGTLLTTWGALGDDPGQFRSPVDVAVDAAGNVVVADLDNGRIQAFSANGDFLTAWEAERAPSGSQNLPYAVALDGEGGLFLVGVSDDHDSEGNVQKFRLPPLA